MMKRGPGESPDPPPRSLPTLVPDPDVVPRPDPGVAAVPAALQVLLVHLTQEADRLPLRGAHVLQLRHDEDVPG